MYVVFELLSSLYFKKKNDGTNEIYSKWIDSVFYSDLLIFIRL